MSAVVPPLKPPTDLQRLDQAIGDLVISISQREDQIFQLEAGLSISRSTLAAFRDQRDRLRKATRTPTPPSPYLAARIHEYRTNPPLDPLDV